MTFRYNPCARLRKDIEPADATVAYMLQRVQYLQDAGLLSQERQLWRQLIKYLIASSPREYAE